MRVDYRPVEPPHECTLPPAGGYPLGTVITCQEIVGHRFNGREETPVPCLSQWRRSRTMWRHRPTWDPEVFGW